MNKSAIIRMLFVLSGLYDGVLGLAFLLAGPKLFEMAKVPPPNHFGYVHFPAALLIVFGIMFFAVALDPVRSRNLIPYGVLLKLAYSGCVFYHWATGDVPTIWKPFAFIDVAWAAVFVWAYSAIPRLVSEARAGLSP